MSALAQLLRARGDAVSGSDRYFDMGQLEDRANKLVTQGVRLSPQDGTGVHENITHIVRSSAIETDNLDMARARDLGLASVHRSSLLASIFHSCDRRIAVTGSFGKTTITGMIGWALAAAGLEPTVVNGGIMRNFETERYIGNAVPGDGILACIEADESDGTCVKYQPTIGVITGLARDHKELDELQRIYRTFAENTSDAVVMSVQASATLFGLPGPRRVTFGLRDGDVRPRSVRLGNREIRFSVGRVRFRMRQIGQYSVFNALATIAVLRELGVSDARIEAGLRSFDGLARHMELVDRVRGVRVYDDFAHNPSKIAAAIEAVRAAGAERVIAVFQPHGFSPARFMRTDLAEAFARVLGSDDRAFLLPIYYVGGTAARDISSENIAADAVALGAPVYAVPDRATLAAAIADCVRENDTILVMGARDDSLRTLCRDIATGLAETADAPPRADGRQAFGLHAL